jgi:hypothetical protein
MPPIRFTSRADRLLQHYRIRGKAYPAPRYWERLSQMLEEEAEKRGKTPPPPPLTHSMDHDPTDEEKTERLREQVAWADRNSLLHRVQMFFEAMPPSGWTRGEK